MYVCTVSGDSLAIPAPPACTESTSEHLICMDGCDQTIASRARCILTKGNYVTAATILRSGAYCVACMGTGEICLFDLTGDIIPPCGVVIGEFKKNEIAAPKKIHLVEDEGPDGCCFVFIGKMTS